jgi:hypothetical protein
MVMVVLLPLFIFGSIGNGCPVGDLTADCEVDLEDLQVLANQWLAGPGEPADLNGDGRVDISDFAIFAGEWLKVGQPTGSVQVTISPPEAVAEEAQWRVDGGTWQDSGTTVGGLSVGQHTVDFSSIFGWTEPNSEVVQIIQGELTTLAATYVQQPGLLRVYVYPQTAVNAGARWRVDGGAWQQSGIVQTGLSGGLHTVEFSPIYLWLEPDDQDVAVINGEMTIAAGTYGPLLVINEFMASNSNYKQDTNDGHYEDWIEIYNADDQPINIANMYLEYQEGGQKTLWRFPSNVPALTTIGPYGYRSIWADKDTGQAGLHANFKLDADNGGQITLLGSNGSTLVDRVSFGEQTPNISYGRYPDANDGWQFMQYPTAGSKNNGGYEGVVEDIQFSHNRGFYDAPFSVTITTETNDATILYTLDGSPPYDIKTEMPTATAQDYAGPIPITTTTTLRAAALKIGWKPTGIKAHTYIFLDNVIQQSANPAGYPGTWPGGSYSGAVTGDYQVDPDVVNNPLYSGTIKNDLKAVPTFSLVMKRDDWFGSTGIYINQSQDGTERPASIEFFDPTSGEDFQINCAMAMQGGVTGGGTSLDRWKSFKLSMRPRFKIQTDDGKLTGGPGGLDYQLFSDSPIERFDTVVFDGVLNHSWLHPAEEQRTKAMYINDQYVADLHNAMGGFSPHGSHAHVYINGLYWGMYYIHERPDHSWAAEMFGGDKEEYDALKHSSSGVINDGLGGSGATANFNAMLSAANAVAADPTNLAKYQTLCNLLDVDNFITYSLANWFAGNTDWPQKNWYFTHRNTPDGRWRIHSWDAEHTVDEGSNDVGESPVDIHNKLKGNAEYLMRFADLIHKHFFNGGVLATPNPANMYQARMTSIDRAIVGESARWGDNRIPSSPYTRQNWLNFQNTLLSNLFPNRSTTVLGWLKTAGLYPNVNAPVFYINSSYKHGGYILPTDQLSMTASAGTIYYTVDGNDPRLPGAGQQGTNVTLVAESANKRVLVPTAAISDNWKGDGAFDDSGWNDGTYIADKTGGVGLDINPTYDPYISYDVQAKMYDAAPQRDTCYIRIPFTVSNNTSEFNSMTLRMRYEDGFIAYINGDEVARRNFTGTPVYNSSASTTHSDSLAVVFEDISVSGYIGSLHQGSNILAIHGLNYATNRNDFLISAELVASKGGSASGISPSAIQYTSPFTLNKSTHLKSRLLSGSTWSALNEAVFAIGPIKEKLRITEIMFHPQDTNDPDDPNEEFIELKNTGTQTINLNLVKFTNGIDFSFSAKELAAGQYIVVVKDLAAFEKQYGTGINIAGQYSGSLDNKGERIRLEDALGQTIQDFKYGDGWREIADGNGFSLTIINAANPDPNSWGKKDSWRASAYWGGSPGEDDSGILPNPGDVMINEILAHSHAGAPDWIELRNTTGAAINIGGWFLSDSATNLKKYRIANGTTIPLNGYKVFYEDTDFGDGTDPGCLEVFALSENGETVYLSSALADGTLTGYRDTEDFGASQTDVSFGRYKTSQGNYNFVAMSSKTPNTANAYPKVGPIVINEIMYHPDWPAGGTYSNDEYEYIELRNTGGSEVTLYDANESLAWRFTDGIDWTFPNNTRISGGGYIVVVRNKTAFQWRYPAVPVGKIYGPYSGHLDNAGESLELSKPGDVDGLGVRHWIRVERINYSDGSHPEDCPGEVDLWPVDADGGGMSLSRRFGQYYGNDPNNWTASVPSPAASNP